MAKSNSRFSTYAQIIVSQLQILRALILKYSDVSKPEAATPTTANVNIPNLLSVAQIENSLRNPQSPIKSSMRVYATETEARRFLDQLNESLTHQRRTLIDTLTKLQDRLAGTTNPVQQKELKDAIKALEEARNDTIELQKQLPQRISRLDTFAGRIEKLTQEQDKEWDAFRQKYGEEIATSLKDAGLNLNDEEIQSLQNPKTWPEVISALKERGVAVPANIHAEKPDYSTFLELNASLVIHKFLERRMLPNGPSDVEKYMKNLFNSDPQQEGMNLANSQINKMSLIRTDITNVIHDDELSRAHKKMTEYSKTLISTIKQYDLLPKEQIEEAQENLPTIGPEGTTPRLGR